MTPAESYLPGVHHLKDDSWLLTPSQDPYGYIQPQRLDELWFHTGTICNLSCPFCLEGSKPGDNRLNQMTINEVRPFLNEAVDLGVKQFSFTGGEPFVTKNFIHILEAALQLKPCLVLTNATRPLNMQLDQVSKFVNNFHPLSFRVSIDFPDAKRHDINRGEGNFDLAFKTARTLMDLGFRVSIARHKRKDENYEQEDSKYRRIFKHYGLPLDTFIVAFPDFLTPGSIADVPHITNDCMTRYHTEESRHKFMCNFSKMIVKKDGKMRVYACTLVDDDADYDLGNRLTESMKIRIMLKHHRCYSCFAYGASCSET